MTDPRPITRQRADELWVDAIGMASEARHELPAHWFYAKLIDRECRHYIASLAHRGSSHGEFLHQTVMNSSAINPRQDQLSEEGQ